MKKIITTSLAFIGVFAFAATVSAGSYTWSMGQNSNGTWGVFRTNDTTGKVIHVSNHTTGKAANDDCHERAANSGGNDECDPEPANT